MTITSSPQLHPRCPACRRRALFLAEGGHVTCGSLDCPNPDAVNQMLEAATAQPARQDGHTAPSDAASSPDGPESTDDENGAQAGAESREPAWVDGDPVMEAIAAAIYNHCGRHPDTAAVCDDPRTIAAVAAAAIGDSGETLHQRFINQMVASHELTEQLRQTEATVHAVIGQLEHLARLDVAKEPGPKGDGIRWTLSMIHSAVKGRRP